MKALEFKTKIKDNKILIPDKIKSQLKANKDIRVIIFIEDSEIYDNIVFQQSTTKHFFNGYAESDSIYDNY